jgi:ketosteroid isomerase-like protein
MNDIETNKRVCVQFFDLVCAREYDRAMQLLREDVEWWVSGDLPTSGTYHGRNAVTGLFGLLRDNVPAGLKIHFTAITAEEDRVAIEMNSEGEFANGRSYRNIYHMLFWVHDGLISKVHEHLDTKYTAIILST